MLAAPTPLVFDAVSDDAENEREEQQRRDRAARDVVLQTCGGEQEDVHPATKHDNFNVLKSSGL